MKKEYGTCTHCGVVGNTENLIERNICGQSKCEKKREKLIKEFEKQLSWKQ